MNSEGSLESSNIQAEGKSIAIGGLSVGGSVGGDIRIGHTIGFTSEQVSTLITQISTTFQPKPFDGRSPYKGLDVFEEEDAELFFGREKLVEDLVSRVKESPVVFVNGSSGSGKSSLVRAGLIPALKKAGTSKDWLYATTKPGRDPIEAVASAFSRLKDPAIGAMQPEELVSAIAQPALLVGLPVEPQLVAQIINDMQGEPGALPLMQFALKDLFDSQQARGNLIELNLKDYLDRGGIHKALELHADKTFEKFSPEEQALARSIFSGLIEVGRGTQDTKRTALFDELVPANTNAQDVEVIVRKLADARLITTDEKDERDTVTLAHEKLIDAWPWLKKLVNENRDVIALQNEISVDAKEWDEHHRDASYLYTGARLINAREKLETNNLVLSGSAYEFVKAGQAQQRRGQVIRFFAISTIVGLVIVAITIYMYQGNLLLKQNLASLNTQVASAGTSQALAATAQSNEKEAQKQTNIALSRQLFIQAQSGISKGIDKEVILLLAIQSMRLFPSTDSSQIMQDTTESGLFEVDIDSFGDTGYLGLYGKYLISDDLHIWDVGTRKEMTSFTIPTDSYPFSISEDGKYILLGNCSKSVDVTGECIQAIIRVWDISTGKEIAHFMQDALISPALQFAELSPDGRYIALVECNKFGGEIVGTYSPITTCIQSIAHIYEIATNKEVRRITNENDVVAVAFSPDGKYVVAGGPKGTVSVLELISGKETNYMQQNSFIKNISHVSFSPDGKHVAASGDGGIILWEATTSQEVARITTDNINFSYFSTFSFSPDSKYVASLNSEAEINIWEVSTGREIASLQSFRYMRSVVFSPDGEFLIGIDDSSAVKEFVWKSQDQIAKACSRATRNLTRAEWKQYIGDALPYHAVCANLPIEPEPTATP